MVSISEFSQSILGWVPTYTRPRIDSDQYINNMSEKFQDNPEIANQFKILWWFKSWLLNDSRKNIINAYNIFEESTNPAFRNYMQTSLSQWSKMLSDIDRQRQQAEAYYWPWWEAERMIDDYVVKYGNLIAQQAQWSQALAKNVWTRAGGSQAAIRAWVSQQQAMDAENLIKFQEKRVGDLTNLYNIYNNLISSLRAESAWANQQFIIQPLAQALERQTQIAGALVQNEAQLNNMRIQMSMAASGSGSKNPMDIFNYFKSAGFSDEDATTMTNQLLGWATNTTWTNEKLTYNTSWGDTPIKTKPTPIKTKPTEINIDPKFVWIGGLYWVWWYKWFWWF